MPDQQVVQLRNRILGILIHNARERARASLQECANALGISKERYAAYEEGVEAISLPELELLGRYLGAPLEVLRDEESRDDNFEVRLPDPTAYCNLRNRIIGVRLRQARLKAGYTQEDVAKILGHSSSTISAYEYGKRPIGLAELEVLARELGVSMREFLDTESEIGQWHQAQKQFEQFMQLSEEMRDFVLRPINKSYLELAMKLAAMPAGALRQIAEGLLEITY
ncbi:MAG: helix-turn-helix domain-containing protein [Anaerolineae bacterium]